MRQKRTLNAVSIAVRLPARFLASLAPARANRAGERRTLLSEREGPGYPGPGEGEAGFIVEGPVRASERQSDTARRLPRRKPTNVRGARDDRQAGVAITHTAKNLPIVLCSQLRDDVGLVVGQTRLAVL